jgi:hypothetical protein
LKLKKKEGVSSRTISPPIADPPQVLVKIPIIISVNVSI